jgi:hypothetical protein
MSCLYSARSQLSCIASKNYCIIYFYIFIMKSYDEVQNNKKCTSTNINESKSDMHDQGDR